MTGKYSKETGPEGLLEALEKQIMRDGILPEVVQLAEARKKNRDRKDQHENSRDNQGQSNDQQSPQQ